MTKKDRDDLKVAFGRIEAAIVAIDALFVDWGDMAKPVTDNTATIRTSVDDIRDIIANAR